MYFVEKAKGIEFFKKFDYLIFLPVLVMSLFGLTILKSVTLTRGDAGMRIMLMQIIGLALGIVLAFIISSVDYKDLKTLSFVFYGVSILLLIFVLVFGTGDQLGSRSWIRAGSFSFQPSEITKITFIIIISMYLEKMSEDYPNKRKNLTRLIVFTIIPLFLIVLQRDFGTTMVFLFILLAMIIAHGTKIRHLILVGSIFIMTSPLIWFFVLNDRRKERILVFLNPERDPLGSGYNVIRSKMTVGSGQIFGKGIFQGVQTQNFGVPVQESDFVFSAIGEELGFVGALFIITLVIFLILRCTYISLNSRDIFGSYLVVGVSAMLGFHFIENIGMNIGILPVTGIPLPFISAGGSSMVTNYIAIGVVMSVSLRRKRNLFASG